MIEDQLELIFGNLTVVKAIIWAAAAIAFIAAVVKLWPAFTKFVATVNALSALPAKLKLLDEIHHEVRPNTGTSMNDALQRVEAEQQRQASQLNGQDEKLSGLQHLMESGDADLSSRVSNIEDTIDPRKGTR
ncbi:hypothetical protein ACFWHR_03830 [Leucobacter sp. NPDC058333]|uniref:hypothetical protein n=1 Tax=Leucobacter sp. NPDC058333 TaxID=3346450 RepID=UPI003662B4BE